MSPFHQRLERAYKQNGKGKEKTKLTNKKEKIFIQMSSCPYNIMYFTIQFSSFYRYFSNQIKQHYNKFLFASILRDVIGIYMN